MEPQEMCAALFMDIKRKEHEVYICGLKDMIESVKKILIEKKGFKEKDIHLEKYD